MADPDSVRALHPLRRLTMPGGRTLLRAVLVTALLGLAAAVLHAPPSCPPGASSSPGSAGSDDAAGQVDGGGSPGPDAPETGGPPSAGPTGEGSTAADDGSVRPLPLPSGAVGVPIRLAEPAALVVARPGTRVDLLAAPPDRAGAEAALLAPAALVLGVLGGDTTDGSTALYLALRPDQAQRAVGLPEGTRFAVVVRG
ncbi:flagellar biosynthesis protein FlgA [Micromonospora sp. WMMD967]|uniref:flagellar biosynthesis protein FlgA n=1 Tax=Micromonospora sp. WMMD967 TaxID=3016101 RepID=UPI0024178185|nr:flagellar biosynthesis protein FlgA [Micromonospora sp. WMMD967]MDG4836579.1 flagellar biosynthesis protein FlgA [Micromonospora sp. WMMD967]